MLLKRFFYLFSIFLVYSGAILVGQSQANIDTLEFEADTLLANGLYRMDSALNVPLTDTIPYEPDPSKRLSPEKEIFEDEINYTADSIVGIGSGIFLLYGNAEISYGEGTKLRANFIRMNMDSSVVYALGGKDSVGAWVGKPEFEDQGTVYVSEEMIYNFNSGKGFITNVVTEQGEGYVTSNETKRIDENTFCMRNGKYTTCDNHGHPHFYLKMSKAKVRPGKNIVTGPAHLVIEDVPLPLILPFGFFPFTDTYTSGFIVPEFGEEQRRGFFLSDGGYYFALSDYFDLKMLGSIYTLGSWDVSASSKYKLRYKFSGNFSAKYMVNSFGDKGQDDYSRTKDFRINWSHRQDPKANMYQTFSASVNFSTSSYDRNNVNTVYNPELRSQNHKQSSVSYSRRFAELPMSLSASAQASQNSRDSTLSLSFPQINFSVSRITPFKRKKQIGSTRWYEKIGMSYSAVMSNSISGKEEDVFNSDLIEDWRNGVRHSIPVSTSFNIFNNLTLTPSLNYTERWYSSRLEKSFDYADSTVQTDTIYGFNRVWDYSTSFSAATKLYGFYKPWRKLFGDKVEAIRHVFTPSVSLSYRPDFGQEKYGYYGTYDEIVEENDSTYYTRETTYSKYQGALYGNAARGKYGAINFNINNNLEMKVRSERDTANEFTKIKLIESFNISSGYNMAVDSFQWSNISMNVRTKIFKKYSININATFDPYMYEVDANGNGRRVNRTWWAEERKIGQLISANTGFGYRIDNKIVKGWFSGDKEPIDPDASTEDPMVNDLVDDPYLDQTNVDMEEEDERSKKDPYGYMPFEMPWSISANFSFSLRSRFNAQKDDYDYDITSNLRLNGSLDLTDKWKITASSGYDFNRNEITSTNFNISRNLHCWSMNMSVVPFGTYQTYRFTIKVNSSILSDLKYEQQKSPWDRNVW